MQFLKLPTENRYLHGSIISLSIILSIILIFLSLADLTGRESALLGTVLTIASVFAGGLITHAYSQQSTAAALDEISEFHQKNLRTYALKAAEKVNNLSKELSRLSLYLAEELEESDYRSVDEELLAKEERIQSTIHMLDTLKSVNDTSLSDWRGVIGEELHEQRVEEEERAEELNELLDRFAALEAAHLDTQKKFDAIAMKQELEEIKKGFRTLAKEITGIPIKRTKEQGYIPLTESCPNCGGLISYRQKARVQRPKAITCKQCSTSLISEYFEPKGFELRVRKPLPELLVCPACDFETAIELDEFPTASASFKCQNCEESIRVSRGVGILKVNLIPVTKTKYPVTEELIEKIRHSMPSQPWAKQIHKTVAEELGLPHQQVQKAIQHLIRMGVFKDQIDGQICTTEEKLRLMREVGQNL